MEKTQLIKCDLDRQQPQIVAASADTEVFGSWHELPVCFRLLGAADADHFFTWLRHFTPHLYLQHGLAGRAFFLTDHHLTYWGGKQNSGPTYCCQCALGAALDAGRRKHMWCQCAHMIIMIHAKKNYQNPFFCAQNNNKTELLPFFGSSQFKIYFAPALFWMFLLSHQCDAALCLVWRKVQLISKCLDKFSPL